MPGRRHVREGARYRNSTEMTSGPVVWNGGLPGLGNGSSWEI